MHCGEFIHGFVEARDAAAPAPLIQMAHEASLVNWAGVQPIERLQEDAYKQALLSLLQKFPICC